MEWKPQKLYTFAEIVKAKMELKLGRKSHLGSFTMLMKTIFGPSGGGVHCKGIALDISERSLTTATKEVCLQICNCREELAPLKTGEHFVSQLVALGPNKDPLRAPAKLCLPLHDDMCTDHVLFLRWSPTEVDEPTKWKDVLPGTFHGQFAGPTVRLQIVSARQVKITTNTFGLFCIISREPCRTDDRQNDGLELNTGSFLSQGISGILKLVGQKLTNGKTKWFEQDKERSEEIALIR